MQSEKFAPNYIPSSLFAHEFQNRFVSTRFVSTRFVSNAEKLVSWALVSWAEAKNSFRETRFVSRSKKLVSWAISRVSWAKVLTSLLTSLVISDCIFSYLFSWIDIPSTYPTPKFSQVPMYSFYPTHSKANNVGPYYLDRKLLNGMLLLFQS